MLSTSLEEFHYTTLWNIIRDLGNF